MKNIEILDLEKKSDERGWLIEVLGGEIHLQSQLGEGSEFTLRLSAIQEN